MKAGEEVEEVFGGIIDKTFSIAVSAFLLLRMERELKLLRASIDRLRHCSVCSISPLNNEETNPRRGLPTGKLWKAYASEGEEET